MTIGENIKKYRKARGLTQHELGELIDVEQYTISQYENSTKFPRLEFIEKLAEALNITVINLLPKYDRATFLYATSPTLEEIEKFSEVVMKEELFREIDTKLDFIDCHRGIEDNEYEIICADGFLRANEEIFFEFNERVNRFIRLALLELIEKYEDKYRPRVKHSWEYL